METDRTYLLPFKGLSLGKHPFSWQLGKDFFSEFEQSEITDGCIDVSLLLEKKADLLTLDFHLKGSAVVMCDRCLDDVSIPVDYTASLFVKFGEETYEASDELLVLSYEEHELDVAQYLYEYAHLALPYRRVHPVGEDGEPACNKEMMTYLKAHLIQTEKE